MSTPLEPREVDKPYLRRWSRDTLALFVRSPLRFGLLIAVLGLLDTFVVKVTEGLVIDEWWIEQLGVLLLPAVWAVVSAVARGADDGSQTWVAVRSLARHKVWSGALTTGAGIVMLNWVVAWSLGPMARLMLPARPDLYLHHSGEFIGSTGVGVILVFAFVGLCYFPLLVLISDISPSIARRLSRQAESVNGGHLWMQLYVGTTALTGITLASVAPAYGMTMAACIVFLGVFYYVAYRDIFERRSGNLPKAVALAARADGRVQMSRRRV